MVRRGSVALVALVATTLVMFAAPPRAAGATRGDAIRPASGVAASLAAAARSYEHTYSATAGIPAFARKYGLPCSACHTVWPELSAFGQAFKDNGYQLGNDRDSPINQNPSYFPIALRTTPQYHYESTTQQVVDQTPGNGASGTAVRTITQQGFDLSGIDFLMLGTLYKNITLGLVPTLDPDGTMGIEAAFVRFDNIKGSPWLNAKVGKFELDNLLSEKRIILLSNNGGLYQSYHFVPYGDLTNFGLGDNQLGLELMGHSLNSYTRYSVAVLSSTDGEPGLPYGSSVDASFTVSQAYDAGSLGLMRLGLYAYVGQRPTTPGQSVGGAPVPGTASGTKGFYRIGFTGNLSFGRLELLPFLMHASDNAYLATATPGDQALPAGAKNAVWNAGLVEAHFIVHPQLVFLGRYELIRMSQQALPSMPDNQGNIDAMTIGLRAYPFMFSRDGLAFHAEYSRVKTIGMPPLSGDGTGGDPSTPTTAVWSNSLLLALDFAF